jgi:hypothetical protein
MMLRISACRPLAKNYQTAAPVVNETMREFGGHPGELETRECPARKQGLATSRAGRKSFERKPLAGPGGVA